MTILIRGGQVLAGAPAALQRADVLIEGDRIVAMGPGLTAPPGARVIEAADRLVLPGMGNAHTHAAATWPAGRVGSWTLEDLLTYSPANSGFRTPDDEYLSAAIGAIEMLKTGCTGAYDLYIAMPAITDETFAAVVQAYTDVGVRVVLAPAVADVVFYQTVPGLIDLLPPDLRRTIQDIRPAPTKGLLDLTERAIRRWHGSAEGRVRVAVAPTIPNQATDELLDGCAALAREYGVGFHTHLAESKVQVVESQRRWGKSIVGRLADHRVLGPASWARIPSGSTTMICGCWPTRAPRSPTIPEATCAWVRHRAGARDAGPRRGGGARDRRLDLRGQPEPLRGPAHRLRSSAPCGSRTRPPAGSTPIPSGAWPPRAPRG